MSKQQQPRQWYQFRNAADGERHAELEIYSEIGESFWWESVSANEFVRDLNALDVDTISLRINSPGGSVFDGVAIYNALIRHKATITAYVDGFAASIASVIMLAADRIVMGDGALVMIHNPTTYAWGFAEDLREQADLLDKIRDEIVALYAKRTGSSVEDLATWMAATTWMGGVEAIERGFAHELADEAAAEPTSIAARAQFDQRFVARIAKQAPAAIAARLQDAATAPSSSTDTPAGAPNADAPAGTSAVENVEQTNPEWDARLRELLATR